MEKIIEILFGYVNISVKCRWPERFLNICSQNGIELWGIKLKDAETVEASLLRGDYKKLKASLPDGMELSQRGRIGVPFFLSKFRRRYVLLAAMAVSLCMMWVSTLFVWEIRISGCETVPEYKVRQCLYNQGIKVGVCWVGFSQEDITNRTLLELPELSYITVNVNSSIAEVIVREKIEVPETVDRDLPTSIYAEKAGLIDKVTALEGKTVKKRGEAVLEGDELITGAVENIDGTVRFVHAKGSVFARTWYEISAVGGGKKTQKSYTGEEKTRYALKLGNKRLNLYINSGISYDDYDKIVKSERITIFGKLSLPVVLQTETYREYEAEEKPQDASQIKTELEQFLKARLLSHMSHGTIMEYDCEYSGGRLKMRAKCSEQIGAERQIDITNYREGTEGDR